MQRMRDVLLGCFIVSIGLLCLAAMFFGNASAQSAKFGTNGYPLFWPHSTIYGAQLKTLADKGYGNRTGIDRLRTIKKDGSAFNQYSANQAASRGTANGVATLDGSGSVAQNPASASGSPAAASILFE